MKPEPIILPPPGEDPSKPSTLIPIVHAAGVSIPEADHPAMHSAKNEKEALQVLVAQVLAAISKPLALLRGQFRTLSQNLAGADARALEAMKTLAPMHPTRPAIAGSTGLCWPTSALGQMLVIVFLGAGLALTLLGWWNSAHVSLIFLQRPLWSYGFTAPLLFLPLAVHLLTRQLGARFNQYLSFVLAAMAFAGAGLLISEIGHGAAPSVDLFEGNTTGPNPLHLLVGQVLLEISSGVLLIQHGELHLHCPIDTIPNPDYEAQLRHVNSLKAERDSLADQVATVEAEIKALEAKGEDWTQRHLLRWKARNA